MIYQKHRKDFDTNLKSVLVKPKAIVDDEINSPVEEISFTINVQSQISITWLLSVSCLEAIQLV
ncbi:hypothetical protein MAH4_02970 [Sessilibacter sp. MAH4]